MIRRAFTLIEVMIAGAILAVGATAVLAAYSTTLGLIEHQRRLVSAVDVTQSKLEELLACQTTSPELAAGSHAPETVDQLGRAAAAGPEAYTVEYDITMGNPSAGYMLIVVQTSWHETKGARFTKFAAFREQ